MGQICWVLRNQTKALPTSRTRQQSSLADVALSLFCQRDIVKTSSGMLMAHGIRPAENASNWTFPRWICTNLNIKQYRQYSSLSWLILKFYPISVSPCCRLTDARINKQKLLNPPQMNNTPVVKIVSFSHLWTLAWLLTTSLSLQVIPDMVFKNNDLALSGHSSTQTTQQHAQSVVVQHKLIRFCWGSALGNCCCSIWLKIARGIKCMGAVTWWLPGGTRQ